LYEFPLLETEADLSPDAISDLIHKQILIENEILDISRFNEAVMVHKLTHQHLNIYFWKVRVAGKLSAGIDWKSVKKLPFPIVIHNFIEAERF
jgi:A/G-specific adenine glycosylase